MVNISCSTLIAAKSREGRRLGGDGTHKQPYSQADTCEVLGRSGRFDQWETRRGRKNGIVKHGTKW